MGQFAPRPQKFILITTVEGEDGSMDRAIGPMTEEDAMTMRADLWDKELAQSVSMMEILEPEPWRAWQEENGCNDSD
jgi:hypothetical protein